MQPIPIIPQAARGRRSRRPASWPRLGRWLVLVVMALGLMFDGSTRAMALAHTAGAEAIVICAEEGAKTILLSASGEPIEPMGPMHDCDNCPKCSVATFALVVPPARNTSPAFGLTAAFVVPFAPTRFLTQYLRPQARSPPAESLGMRAPSDACS